MTHSVVVDEDTVEVKTCNPCIYIYCIYRSKNKPNLNLWSISSPTMAVIPHSITANEDTSGNMSSRYAEYMYIPLWAKYIYTLFFTCSNPSNVIVFPPRVIENRYEFVAAT